MALFDTIIDDVISPVMQGIGDVIAPSIMNPKSKKRGLLGSIIDIDKKILSTERDLVRGLFGMEDEEEEDITQDVDTQAPSRGGILQGAIDTSGEGISDVSMGDLDILEEAKKVYGDTPQAKVAAAQAALESGLLGGKPSQLASKHKNLFGIKGSGTAGAVELPTSEFIGGKMQKVRDKFSANETFEDSFQQHYGLMNRAKRYQPFMQAETVDDAIDAIGSSGYATDPNYGSKLKSIIKRMGGNGV